MGAFSNWFYKVFPAVPAIVPNSPYCSLHRTAGEVITCLKDVNGTGGAQSINLFQLTGTVELLAIWGVFTDVTEVTSITAASLDLYDGAATVQLTSAAGTALSGAGLGSWIGKLGNFAAALAFNNSTAARASESAFNRVFTDCAITKKAGQNTYIRFTCTTDANTNATIRFYAAWACRDNVTPGSLVAV